jgi:pimeloyl-ACP methyl ester carboxylesterase
VLLHGFGGNAMTFYRLFKNLKQDYKVHALDAMGVGHSTKGNFNDKFTYE